MKSPFTDKEMKVVREKDVLQFRKESFSFYRFAYKCEDTGELFTDSVMQELNLNQIYNQYREKYNIPFPEEIRKIRKKYGLSASKMSSILGFGTNSYRQYENGDIPSISNAKLIHLAKNPLTFKQMVLDSSDLTKKESSAICDKIDELISKNHHDKTYSLKALYTRQ
ncbi:type II TA system antitoxin MqsA family protein [Flavobacterium sp. HJ-32-4]|uniref:type II TA system antitoxin MqsA family protein n=1 Tax=Flavobacterium sp. HJ-32-4 TaxID=1160795 RepID=UPI001F131227|nr:type II TA system antitoxin MqsA family protein [Flavobacterium sp. HJ-32-4]UMY65298.1 type II toxin-antitoxin system MqsA family antitoxin [Flavobacterium sp. HJ-32-4]